ncbi:TIGR03086 family metal-binding protein [Streptomyces ficellus]|uniref:TIGR03086 family metal-binding protein n=1 Tax=Streptomyces ficellus TaxID=1977088 RepID=A0ABT7Z3F9_9ACTN|nr:TIGR03086 family metal-binding protein [Streptomyces ficellus]MDN3294029.1 TIGR03086 family metal-binding protein [Streptomyces ficellus]
MPGLRRTGVAGPSGGARGHLPGRGEKGLRAHHGHGPARPSRARRRLARRASPPARRTRRRREPDAWQGTTRAGGVTLPGEVAGAVALYEVLVHGWDLARATGQEYAPDVASLRACCALLAPAAGGPGQEGVFGSPVPVPDDAPLLDRVVGLSGRRPDWQPGS